MNEENQELLSAYLDGALPEPAKRELEARLAASAELRRELEELRAVSRAIKDLPKEPLPPGFMARFQARRARNEAPQKDYVFLPPGLRPVAFALSCGVVALMIWDRAVVPPEINVPAQNPARVTDASNAPVSQMDLSAVAGAASSAARADAQGLDLAGPVPRAAEPGEELPALAEKPEQAPAASDKLQAQKEAEPPARARSLSALRGAARAPGRPLAAAGGAAGGAGESAPQERDRRQMTEEERSARNEQMFGYIEAEKKRMGIAKVLKREEAEADSAFRARPAAPPVASPAPRLLKKQESASGPAAVAAGGLAARAPAAAPAAAPSGRLAPDAGLVFSDASSLASSWVLLGFPGDPPSIDFSSNRLVLIKPSATKILSVSASAQSVDVVYRQLTEDETADPARDRVAPIPLEPRAVRLFDASPR